MRYTTTTSDDLLLTLSTYHFLTLSQITKLLNKEKTRTNIREKLKKLVSGGLVETTSLPRRMGGSMPYIYSLTRKGQRLLDVKDGAAPGRKSSAAVAHTLAINSVAIQAKIISQHEPRLALHDLRLESQLKKCPVQLSPDRFLVPDLFVSFNLSPPFGKIHETLGLTFEIDLNTEDKTQIQSKIRNYVAFSEGPYQAYFGLESLTIVFVAPGEGGTRRVRELLAWAEQVLKETPDAAELFLFSDVDAAASTPLSFLCDPFFRQPFRAAPTPLIEKTIPLNE